MTFPLNTPILRTYPRFATRRVNGKLIRAVVNKVTREGVITASEIVDGIPMSRVQFKGGLISWEPDNMLIKDDSK